MNESNPTQPAVIVVYDGPEDFKSAQKILARWGFRWRGGESEVEFDGGRFLAINCQNWDAPHTMSYYSESVCLGSGDKLGSEREIAFVVLASELTDELVSKFPGAQVPKPAKISRDWLASRNACRAGLDWFVDTFGERAEVDRAVLRAALPEDEWRQWLDNH